MSKADDLALERQPSMTTLSGQGGMELREIIALLWSGKWLIAGFVAAGLALSLAYAFLATPVYRADAMLQIQQQNSSLSNLSGQSDILSTLFSANSQAQAEIQIMTSRAVIDPVIRKMHLDLDIKGAPYGAVRISKLTVPRSWYGEKLTLRAQGNGSYILIGPEGGTALTGKLGHTARADSVGVLIKIEKLDLGREASATLIRQPVQKAFTELSKRLNAIEMGRDTGIVKMSLEGTHPVHVSKVLNALVEQYLHLNVAVYSAQARRSLKFVNKQLPNLKAEMNAAEDQLTNYQVSHNTVNIDEQAKALLQEFNTLEGDLTQLQLAEAALGQQYTNKYPAYAAMEKQKSNIQKQLNLLKDRLDNLPKDEQGYVRLKRDTMVYTTLYTTLLGKEQDLRIAAAGAVGSARVVDSAVVPLEPVSPKKALNTAVGLIFGIILGIGCVALRYALGGGISDPLEIENRFAIPLYAVIQHSKVEEKIAKNRAKSRTSTPGVLASVSPHDPAVEALRGLRATVGISLRNKNQIVAISSLRPGDGKSFVSANLAYLSARSGMKTLLIDGDLRKGHLNSYLINDNKRGFAEFLDGQADVESCIRKQVLDDNLDFIPTGKYPENPAELYVRQNLGEQFKNFLQNYDLVVIDLPPVLGAVDPLIVMRESHFNLLVMRAGQHNLREIAFSLSRFRQNGIVVSGFAMNNLSKEAFTSDYSYAYKYTYK